MTTTQEPTMAHPATAIITRPSAVNGRPFTRTVHLVRPFPYTGPEAGQGWIVTNAPGGPELSVLLTDAEMDRARLAEVISAGGLK